MNLASQLLGFLPGGLYRGNALPPDSYIRQGKLQVYQSQDCQDLLMVRMGLEKPIRPWGFTNLFSTNGGLNFYELRPYLINRERSVNGKPPVVSGGYPVNAEGTPYGRIMALEEQEANSLIGLAFVPVRNGEQIHLGTFKQLDMSQGLIVVESARTVYGLPKSTNEYYEKRMRADRLLGEAAEPVRKAMRDALSSHQEQTETNHVRDYSMEMAMLREAKRLYEAIGDLAGTRACEIYLESAFVFSDSS